MIKQQGKLRKVNGILYNKELRAALSKLPDNENYLFFIVDDKKNRCLPSLNYLFAVVLKFISDKLPDHPPTEALYRYFEELFAPPHICTINGKSYKYYDAKREKQIDFSDFIGKIVDYSWREWKIDVPKSEELKESENREFYIQAYAQAEIDWKRFISSTKKDSLKDE